MYFAQSHNYGILNFSEKAAQNLEEGDDQPANKEIVIGEGGESGEITPGKSLVFATLEVCLCVLVRHVPTLNPSPGAGKLTPQSNGPVKLNASASHLVGSAMQIMVELPVLCSPKGEKILIIKLVFLSYI